MSTSVRRWTVLVAALAWVCVACADAGGDAAHVDRSTLAGEWSSPGGARLHLGADLSMTGERLHSAMLGGTSCPDAATGHWSFYSPPDETGTAFADDGFTSGDTLSLRIDDPSVSCLLSVRVRRDEHGLNLCLLEDLDSGCSAEELLRSEPTLPAGRTAK
ncbi:hypothetical protein [Streptomyces sp. NPDC003327]